jgi:Thrombospondin type 1 domain
MARQFLLSTTIQCCKDLSYRGRINKLYVIAIFHRQGDPLPLVHIPFEWTRCSARCGRGGGIHRRNVTCSLLGDGWALDVEEHMCEEDEQLTHPITEKDCMEKGDCPTWISEEWEKVCTPMTFHLQVAALV